MTARSFRYMIINILLSSLHRFACVLGASCRADGAGQRGSFFAIVTSSTLQTATHGVATDHSAACAAYQPATVGCSSLQHTGEPGAKKQQMVVTCMLVQHCGPHATQRPALLTHGSCVCRRFGPRTWRYVWCRPPSQSCQRWEPSHRAHTTSHSMLQSNCA